MAAPYVISQGKDWLVCEKPPGLLSVPGKGPEKQDCLYNRLLEDFPGILVVHRLDEATSGLMIFALNKTGQRDLSRQFEERRIHKEYEALLKGHLFPDEGEVRLCQHLDVEHRPRQVVDPSRRRGKEGLTRWKVLKRMEGQFTRVRLYPLTGRTHQLRLHMAFLGHPVKGDRLYDTASCRPASERLALHACVLEMKDKGGKTFRFESPPPF